MSIESGEAIVDPRGLPPLVTVPEAAPHLRESEWSIYTHIREGTFPLEVVRLGGRKIFVRRRDLLKLLGVEQVSASGDPQQ